MLAVAHAKLIIFYLINECFLAEKPISKVQLPRV